MLTSTEGLGGKDDPYILVDFQNGQTVQGSTKDDTDEPIWDETHEK